jgi:succinate dehydrogenase / fumarate reductase membrane anchor subunit
MIFKGEILKETAYWILHMIAGIIILFVLGLHMSIMHLDEIFGWFLPNTTNPVSWTNVIARSKMLLFIVVYTLLLGFGLFHGLYGFRTILFELNPSQRLKKLIIVLVWCLGCGLFLIGTIANIALKFI